MTSEAPATRVLYIGGAGRSGSTLLELILAQIPGFVAVGELHHLWGRGLAGNLLCGCGTPFRDCPFWAEVGREAFGGWDALDPREMVLLAASVIRRRHLLPLLAPRARPGFSERTAAYGEYMRRLYAAIRAVSDCRIVVDSSKGAPAALLSVRIPNLDLRMVHLIRDSRGVAFSWLRRRVVRPEVTSDVAYMPTFNPLHSGVDWLVANVGLELGSAFLGMRQIRVRYEALCASPRREMERILAFSGVGPAEVDLSFLEEGAIAAGANHSVSGNPVRFQKGRIPLRVDEEWRAKMGRRDRASVLLVTWPLHLAYGYGLPHRQTAD